MAQLLNFSDAASRIKAMRAAGRERDSVKAPGWLLLALEGRAPWELWASLVSMPILKQSPTGDDHPVVVFPGLATGDSTTIVLPPVPTTSIYSRTDGIVAWQCCVEKESDHSENIEVHASHFGIGVNPTALYAIADRLAHPEGQWQRFDREGVLGLKKFLYLDPARKSRFDIF